MSGSAMEWACDARATGALSSNERLVLVVLAKYAQPDGSRAFPGRTLIGAHTGRTTRSISRSLARLRDVGLIAYGDQAYVAHFPYWTRPVVYDLAVGSRANPPVAYEDRSSDADTAEEDEAHGPIPKDPDPVTPVSPPDAGVTPCHQRHPVTQEVAPPDRNGRYPVTLASTKPSTKTKYRTPPVVPHRAEMCRRCDEVHPQAQPCPDFDTDHDTGLANVRAAMRAKPERLEDAADPACATTREERIA